MTIQRSESGYVVHVEGRGALYESAALRRFGERALEEGARLVVDLSASEFVDSTFLGCLVALHQLAEKNCGTVAVCPGETTRAQLERTHIDSIVEVVEQRPAGVGPAVQLPVEHPGRTDLGHHVLEAHRRLAELGGPAADTFQEIAEQLAREIDAPGAPSQGIDPDPTDRDTRR